ncbi:hypothetical protein AAG906_013618 [Vitis piasezkii]
MKAARETRALKEAKDKLQKRVEEFTWRLQLEKRLRENQDLLIKFISQDLGFSGGRPIAACLIYKSLLQWRSFEVERTNVFDRIIQTIGAAIEASSTLWDTVDPPIIWYICEQIPKTMNIASYSKPETGILDQFVYQLIEKVGTDLRK